MAALSLIAIQGTPYEAGLQLGRFGAAAVREQLLDSAAWRSLLPWRETQAVRDMADLTRQRFPRIWQELQGLADGLGLPLDDVLRWNCRGDLWAMAPDGCTTVLLPGADHGRLSHNEDGFPGFVGHCALAQCRIQGSPDFVSFVYPGSLPGHTFAATEHGLCMTVNNIRGRTFHAGLPRMVLARAVLDAVSVPEAIRLLQNAPRSGAFHFGLAGIGQPSPWSVEFSYYGCSALPIEQPSVHANHAIHANMRDFPQLITGSSGLRQVRGMQLLAQAAGAGRAPDPLSILADAQHDRYPIRRCAPDDPDDENTLASADFHVSPTAIHWQVFTHPQEAAVYQLKNGHVLHAG